MKGGKWKPTSPLDWNQASTSTDREWTIPPPNFTGGKWKPSNSKRNLTPPPANHTKGKWKPSSPISKDHGIPPPTFTGSKWTPSKSMRQDYNNEVLKLISIKFNEKKISYIVINTS